MLRIHVSTEFVGWCRNSYPCSVYRPEVSLYAVEIFSSPAVRYRTMRFSTDLAATLYVSTAVLHTRVQDYQWRHLSQLHNPHSLVGSGMSRAHALLLPSHVAPVPESSVVNRTLHQGAVVQRAPYTVWMSSASKLAHDTTLPATNRRPAAESEVVFRDSDHYHSNLWRAVPITVRRLHSFDKDGQ